MNNTDKVKKYFNASNIQEIPEIEPKNWYLPNRAGIIKYIPEEFNKYEILEQDISSENVVFKPFKPFKHQKFVRDYLQFKSPYRGLLLYHSLGTGKTLTAVATTELLLKNKEVIVILPKYLRNNFIAEVKKYSNKFYTKEQYWEFIPSTAFSNSIEEICEKKTIDFKIIKKNKGVWIAHNKKKTNYFKLSQEEQEQIDKQINNIIENRYNFINLDGLRAPKIEEYKKNLDYFDNKVIIIDEVHNLISQVMNGGLAQKLYEILLTRENSKFICLSGTPMVNSPVEIAYLVNLLKGYEKIYHIKKSSKTVWKGTMETFNKITTSQKKIDFYEYDEVNESVMLKILPTGFEKNKADKVMYDAMLLSDDNVIKNYITALKKEKIFLDGRYKTSRFLPLPINATQFNNFFVNEGKLDVKNPKLFKRRILGAISYYTAVDSELYPKLNDTKLEFLNFSDDQFNKYLNVRIKERKNEKSKEGIFSEKGQVYKAYSRALCNFAFPKEITRPYPSDIKYMENEIDNGEETYENVNVNVIVKKDNKTDLYENILNKALKALVAGNYLNETNLSTYSPKFQRAYENICKTLGTVLVYSQFRNVEGIYLFAKVLENRGFAEFKIKKDKKDNNNWTIDVSDEDISKPKYIIFTSDVVRNQILLSIFNSEINNIPQNLIKELKKYDTLNTNEDNLHGSIIKIIMITRSGSEGISLKNVRQVHLFDPYWNQIRLNQVIGRAVRAKSHLALPKNEQNVDVFQYIMKFTKQQIDNDFTIRKKDGSRTTDEVIDNIAQKKMKIINKFLLLLKQGSVDCLVHHKNNPDLACFSFPINIDDQTIIVQPDINEEELNTNVEKLEEKRTIKVLKVIILGKPFIIEKTTWELFDYNLYQNNGTLKSIGFLEKVNEEQYRITVIKKYIKNVLK